MSNSRCCGFTLLETVITIGLMLVMVGSLAGIVISIQNSRQKIQSVQEVEGNMRLALEIIGDRIRSAQGVNIGSSVFGADPGVLSLVMSDPARNPTVFQLDHDDGALTIQEGVSSPVLLTTGDVRVEQLIFNNYSQSNERIHIPFTISISYGSSQDAYARYTETIQTSVSSRR